MIAVIVAIYRLSLLPRDAMRSLERISRYCHDVRPSVRLSICLPVWARRAL